MPRLKSKRYLIAAILGVSVFLATFGVALATFYQATREVKSDLTLSAAVKDDEKLGLFSDEAGTQPVTVLHFQGANFQPPLILGGRIVSQNVFIKNLSTVAVPDTAITLVEPCRDIVRSDGVRIGFMDASVFLLDGSFLGSTCERRATVLPQQIVKAQVRISNLARLDTNVVHPFTSVFGAAWEVTSPGTGAGVSASAFQEMLGQGLEQKPRQ